MSTPQLTLLMQSGPQAGQKFTLRMGAQFIGRAPNNDVVIADPAVSKQHAQITMQAEGAWLQDLGSANGTFVNGQRITSSVWLKPGDMVQIGTSVVLGVQGEGGLMAGSASPGMSGMLVAGLVVSGLVIVVGLGLLGWLLWRPAASSSGQPTPVMSPLPPATTAPAVIMNFTVNKTTVALGECATLRWNVSQAKEVRLDGEIAPAEGERQVCPQEASKTYRLTALSLDGQTKEAAITLTVPATPLPPPGVEISFTADQLIINYGGCTNLRWNIKNAQSVRLDDEKVGPEGIKAVCPTEPVNTYRLLVAPLTGEPVEQTIIINVPTTPTPTPLATDTPTPTATPIPPPQAPVIDKLIADQPTLNQGGCTTLRWTVRNAQSVQLSGGEIGSQVVGNEGARGVCPPAASTTYTLIASGGGGTVQSSITLAILATPTPIPTLPPPPPSGPPKYDLGASVGYVDGDKRCFTLQAYIENVKEAYIDGGEFDDDPITGPSWAKKVCHKHTTTYKLKVVLPDGSKDSVSVTREGP